MHQISASCPIWVSRIKLNEPPRREFIGARELFGRFILEPILPLVLLGVCAMPAVQHPILSHSVTSR